MSISNRKTMLLVYYYESDSKKNKIIKKQEAKGFLSTLRSKDQLSNVPVLENIIFYWFVYNYT